MKVRLVKGPFGGKVMDVSETTGKSVIRINGPKKMTRKQRYELYMDRYGYPPLNPRTPVVSAEYRIAMRPHRDGHHLTIIPCMHPDGSLFYEFIEGSRMDV